MPKRFRFIGFAAIGAALVIVTGLCVVHGLVPAWVGVPLMFVQTGGLVVNAFCAVVSLIRDVRRDIAT